jgi:hypothetical protein
MMHELLLCTNRRPDVVQPRAIGMAKRMPTDPFQPELPSCRPKVILLDGARKHRSVTWLGKTRFPAVGRN